MYTCIYVLHDDTAVMFVFPSFTPKVDFLHKFLSYEYRRLGKLLSRNTQRYLGCFYLPYTTHTDTRKHREREGRERVSCQ